MQDNATEEYQRVIAELRQERDAALAQKAALAEVLEVINRSPSDAQPVFDMILEKAHRLCGADLGAMITYDGVDVQTVVSRGYSEAAAALVRGPSPPSPAQQILIAGERYRHIPDVRAVEIGPDQGFAGGIVEITGLRTFLMVPLRKDGIVRGFLTAHRLEVRPFSEQDIALLESFAAQAVIAMENARLIDEQREALEQQTATAEVLQVINASPGNLAPVFDAVLERALRLCGASFGTLLTYDGEHLERVAFLGVPPAFIEYNRQNPLTKNAALVAQGIATGKPVQATDIMTDARMATSPGVRDALVELGGVRALLQVPLVKDGAVVGFIAVWRREPGVFPETQVALLEGFAAQAVIAIENARLLNEQREALEQQTAMAEVLQVINASPGDLGPVFDIIGEKAIKLCDASFGGLMLPDGERFRAVALGGVPEAYAEFCRTSPDYGRPGALVGQLQAGAEVVHVRDIADTESYAANRPATRALVELGGGRTLLAAALRKDGKLHGAITIYRQEVRPFSDRQITLLQQFAAQAVIAMENARLITEQREALEQQTATAGLLGVINSSPGNLAPVFETILENAHTLCGAPLGSLVLCDGEKLRAVATRGYPPEYETLARQGFLPIPPFKLLLSGEPFVHVIDTATWPVPSNEEEDLMRRAAIEISRIRTALFVPLRNDNSVLGYISAQRLEKRPFTDKQIALLQSFAAQAVIAMENARLMTEQREALEQQTATAEVLQVINASPGDLTPVFDAVLEKATRLCEAAFGELWSFEVDSFRPVALLGVPTAYAEFRARVDYEPGPGSFAALLREGHRVVHVIDLVETELYRNGDLGRRAMVDLGGARSAVVVPLLKDQVLRGAIAIYRQEVRPFSDRQIALLENFAAQAVIAIENARLINEQREALEQQTATAEVLGVINSSPGDLKPVFNAMLDKALRLCGAAFGCLWTYDGERVHAVAHRGAPPEFAEFLTRAPHSVGPDNAHDRLLRGEQVVHIPDVTDDEAYRSGDPVRQALVALSGGRTLLAVPLRKDGAFLGDFVIYRTEVRPFSDKQITLVQGFADQAVVAMENARLLNEVRQRQEELRITFENMGDGVAMFDETQHLVAWNHKFQEILDVADDIIARRQTFSEYVRYLAERGEYDREADPEEHVRGLIERAGQPRTYERTRPDGRVLEIRHNPVAGGGFVLIYADITERKRNEAEIRAARDAAEEASHAIEAAYRDLKAAQASLIQAEKMASLGQLTAGIAHEIKNPLNFVNNFSDLSVDLLNELQEAVALEKLTVADSLRAEIDDITTTLKGNLEKIAEHGRRADSIVKNMLLHSRTGPSEQRAIDVNTTVEEALNLAYHGARAETPGFNITMEKDLDPKAGSIDAFPQEFLRVMLNLISNGFYAARKRANAIKNKSFEPTLHVTTRNLGSQVEIRVRDNGTGISDEVRDKIFEPFFTTKPAGEGTGLGLSLSYDIIVKQHGGQLTVDSRSNEFTEFKITLPRRLTANEGGRA